MRLITILRSITAVAALCLALPASGASIFMVPDAAGFDADGVTTVSIVGDFSDDPTVGGGFDILFDASVLQVTDVTQAQIGDPDFTSIGAIDNVAGIVHSVAFGDFGGIGDANFLIATVTLQIIQPGATNVAVTMQDNLDAAGPFFSAVTFQNQHVQYDGAVFNAPIPLPGAAWLMLGALGVIVGKARKPASSR